MSKDAFRRRGSAIGAILLIAIGIIFLYANLRPDWNPWPLVSRYWPVVLILLGLGKVLDYVWMQRHPESSPPVGLGGGLIALLVVLTLAGVALSRARVESGKEVRETRTVEREGSEAVRARIELGAGVLRLGGGADKLLEADFTYSESEGKPRVDYDVSGGTGELVVQQRSRGMSGVRTGPTHNEWSVRLDEDVPLELKIRLGAGEGDLRLAGLSLTRLEIEMGAGELTADLTGDWKKDLDATIMGGVGSATIRLPKNVGVRVSAAGGLGSINVQDLRRVDGDYVNDAYGKSDVTIRMTIRGGIGEINLKQEP